MNITEAFTDEHFKAYVLEKFCDNRESIQVSDVEQVVSLQLANHKLSSLKGIEHFTALEELDCSYNYLTELDINRNYSLIELKCNNNELRSLDLSNNTKLKTLDFGFNRIRNLDISRNVMLTKLDCCWNLISDLQLEHNLELAELNCGYNALFDLQLSLNNKLTHVDCGSNYLIGLNISGCTNLAKLRCNNNHLTSLDVTGNLALRSLRCFNNHIKALDISRNADLDVLYCSENKISKLDTTNNRKLERLDYANNLIVEQDHTIKGFGTFQYDASLTYYQFMHHYKEHELFVIASVPTKAAIKKISPIIKKVWESFEVLDHRALDLIAENHPDEDVSELVLSELQFAEDGTFQIAYDAGDTPAGQLYIYAGFNNKLEINNSLVYETY